MEAKDEFLPDETGESAAPLPPLPRGAGSSGHPTPVRMCWGASVKCSHQPCQSRHSPYSAHKTGPRVMGIRKRRWPICCDRPGVSTGQMPSTPLKQHHGTMRQPHMVTVRPVCFRFHSYVCCLPSPCQTVFYIVLVLGLLAACVFLIMDHCAHFMLTFVTTAHQGIKAYDLSELDNGLIQLKRVSMFRVHVMHWVVNDIFASG